MAAPCVNALQPVALSSGEHAAQRQGVFIRMTLRGSGVRVSCRHSRLCDLPDLPGFGSCWRGTSQPFRCQPCAAVWRAIAMAALLFIGPPASERERERELRKRSREKRRGGWPIFCSLGEEKRGGRRSDANRSSPPQKKRERA